MHFSFNSLSGSLCADQTYVFVFDKVIECADSVRASSDAGNNAVGKPIFSFKNLFLNFFAYYFLDRVPFEGTGEGPLQIR